MKEIWKKIDTMEILQVAQTGKNENCSRFGFIKQYKI
jgi:hypothetical protein